MSKKLTKAELVDKFLSETPKEFEYFVQHSMEISVRIIELLDKHNLTQREIASKLGKSESEISKWLSGNHNLTLKSISKLESVFNEQIIFTEKEVSEKFNIEITNQLNSLLLSMNESILSLNISTNNLIHENSFSYGSSEIPLNENSVTCEVYSINRKVA